MTYDFSTRMDRLGTRMKQLHNNSLSFERSGETAILVENFTPEATDVNELALQGIPLIADKMQDFVFDTVDLANLANPLPKVGDKVVWNGKTFELFIVGEQVYKFTTSTRKRIRIHSRQIG